jgi:ornithine cyclodeaminase/alanine dehydrogenase-like protein (mu-crystallin family)
MSATAVPAPCSDGSTLLLGRREIASLMSTHDYVDAVEAGFRAQALGAAEVPPPMHIPGQGGAFHAKGARLTLDRDYVAVKLNGNFPDNPRRTGLPTIQGVVLLCDGTDGSVLAVMDSIEITLRRTAAATALAARYLAPRPTDCIAICGCGEQGRAQLHAVAHSLPVRRALVWDVDRERARRFAADMSDALRLEIDAVAELRDATLPSNLIVTATTARSPFLARDMVSPGAFIAAVGADSPEKSELAPGLMAEATIVVDLLSQAVAMGDLHHAIAAGAVSASDVHAELADLLARRRPGRTREDEIIVFDSTGTALQDAASAVWIWRRALASGVGSPVALGAR